MSDIIPIASDHAGFELKTVLIDWLKKNGYTPQDLGTNSGASCDACDFAVKMASAMETGEAKFGVLICGTGQAMAMTANRYQDVRAALCTDTTMARLTREHNDANVLALGARIIGTEVAIDTLRTFLTTPALTEPRYVARVTKLTALGGLKTNGPNG